MEQLNEQGMLISGRFVNRADPDMQTILGAAYSKPDRPRCMCVDGGVEMYVAKYGRFLLKCMPGTGSHHHPSCNAFEPEAENSGAGSVSGGAVRELVDGTIDVRVGFPLRRQTAVRIAPACGSEKDEKRDITVARQTMSMAAFLHLLFERAGLHRWHPTMTTKRSYAVFHRCVIEAASHIRMKGAPLRDLLFVPEPFHPDWKEEIGTRRRRRLALLLSKSQGHIPLMPILGELKSIEHGMGSRKIILKHMPDLPLLVDEHTWAKLAGRFRNVLDAKDSGSDVRAVLGAAVYARSDRELHVDTLTLMLASKYWIPLAGSHELGLHDELVHSGRRFLKPLRYDAKSWSQFANFLLLDAGPSPVALHLIDPWDEPENQAIKEGLIGDSDTWVWRLNEEMPNLPMIVPSRPTSTRIQTAT